MYQGQPQAPINKGGMSSLVSQPLRGARSNNSIRIDIKIQAQPEIARLFHCLAQLHHQGMVERSGSLGMPVAEESLQKRHWNNLRPQLRIEIPRWLAGGNPRAARWAAGGSGTPAAKSARNLGLALRS
jgi:hypothetical protein